jgi:hypothetical protein
LSKGLLQQGKLKLVAVNTPGRSLSRLIGLPTLPKQLA